jgi:hypothetical protein
MKKFVIGCLVVFALLCVVAGVGGYFFYSRILRPGIDFGKSMAAVADIEKDIKNTAAFSTPASGELSEEMVSGFVKIHEHMQAQLGPRMDALKATYDKLDQTLKAENRKASVTEVMGALKDLSTLLAEAKRAQVEGINQAGFSLKEYEWVRTQVFAAVGVVAGGFDVQKLAEQARSGNVIIPSAEKEPVGDVPAKNKELVAPYEKQLKDWAAFAFFGL